MVKLAIRMLALYMCLNGTGILGGETTSKITNTSEICYVLFIILLLDIANDIISVQE